MFFWLFGCAQSSMTLALPKADVFSWQGIVDGTLLFETYKDNFQPENQVCTSSYSVSGEVLPCVSCEEELWLQVHALLSGDCAEKWTNLQEMHWRIMKADTIFTWQVREEDDWVDWGAVESVQVEQGKGWSFQGDMAWIIETD